MTHSHTMTLRIPLPGTRRARCLCGAAGALAALLLSACGRDPATSPSRGRPLPVSVAVAERVEGAHAAHRITGLVAARRTADLGFERAGTVTAINVEEGDAVAGGDVLARLDDARLRARREEARAALRETKAELKLARATLERTRQAHNADAVTDQELDEARERVARLKAARERAAAALASVEVDLGKHVLRAPFGGEIADRMIDEGRVVAAGTPVLRLLETGRKEIVTGLGENPAATLETGDTLDFTIGEHTVEATLRHKTPTRDTATRTVTARFDLPDPADRFRDGALARATLRRPIGSDGFWIPRSALTDNLRGLWAAYILAPSEEKADGETFIVRRVDLEVLYTDGKRVFVRGGLRTGDRYVTGGLQRLGPGVTVTPSGANADR